MASPPSVNVDRAMASPARDNAELTFARERERLRDPAVRREHLVRLAMFELHRARSVEELVRRVELAAARVQLAELPTGIGHFGIRSQCPPHA